MENVRVRNVRVRDDIDDPAYRVLTLRPCVNEYMKDKTPGHIADCSFEKVSVTCNRTEGLFVLQGYDETHKTKNVIISGARLNGNQIKAGDPAMRIGPFTENIAIRP